MDRRPKCKRYNKKTIRRKHRSNSLLPWVRQNLLRYHTVSKEDKRKIDKLDHQKFRPSVLQRTPSKKM